MCASCGCLRPEDDHGDERHITLFQIECAAKAASITVADVIDNIRDSFQVAAALERKSLDVVG